MIAGVNLRIDFLLISVFFLCDGVIFVTICTDLLIIGMTLPMIVVSLPTFDFIG